MSKTLWFFLLWVFTTLPACAQSAKYDDLSARVTRLEGRQSPRVLSEILERLDRLQSEVQQLRGETDQIRHQMERIEDRQQSLYLDLDKRLLELEGGSGRQAPPPAPERVTGEEPESPERPVTAGPANEANPAPEPEPKVASPEEESTPVPSSGNEQPATEIGKGENIYEEAFVYLNNGRYDDAIAGFSHLIETYPNSDYADNAQYWLGETYYVKRDFESARANFNGVIESYPDSNKVPDALLKLGYIEYEESNWKAAREALNTVIERYPDSNSAQLARDRLERMRKERH
ncbi:MAG: tol-pal system protein YbgF [Gammaproteobacteria bacterium]